MSKKKKKNKYSKELKSYATYSKKKKKVVKEDAPVMKKFKMAKSTLDKKDVKKMKKIINKPIKIDETFISKREVCNHSRTDRITVDEFIAMTPAHDAFTPMLETVTNVFGKENVSICKGCYEVIVNPALVPSSGDVMKCVGILYAACDMMKMTTEKDDDVASISKLQKYLMKFGDLLPVLGKVEDMNAKASTAVTPDQVDMKSLNRNFVM